MTRKVRQIHHLPGTAAAIRVACLAVAICAALPGIALALPEISASHFESASSCTCHPEQSAHWRSSMHSKALFDPVFVVEKEMAVAASGHAMGEFCDTCHTPIGTMAGQTAPDKELSRQSKEGVTCDFCHQVTGTSTPPGNASQTLKANGKKRAQIKGAWAPTHVNVYSKFHKTAAFCGACHNLTHPTTGVVLDSTYADWKAGPYAEAGIVCQDCHMSSGPGAGPLTGRAAATGPIRSDIFLMTFAGANVALGDPDRATANLVAAAKVSLDVPEVLANGESSSVTVTVTNVGAGHAIPGGASEIRQMWLEVSAILPGGASELLGRRRFGTVFKDAEGNYPVQVWEAAGIQSQDRIPPKGSVSGEYAFTMPEGDSVGVEAVLRYASFPSELAKKARVKNPVTEMARASATVYGSKRALNEARGWWFGLIPPALGVTLIVLGLIAAGLVGWTLRRRSRHAA